MTDKMSQISTTGRAGVRRSPRARRGVVLTASAAALALVLTGCGSSGEGPASVPTRIPATPVASPPSTDIVGDLVMAQAPTAVIGVDDASKTLIVQTSGPDKLAAWSLAGPGLPGAQDTVVREYDLPADARPVTLTKDGEALVPSPSGLTVISLADGATRTAEVSGAALSAAKSADGLYAVGTDKGSVVILDGDLQQERTVTGFVAVDELVSTGDLAIALDTHQTSVSELGVDTGDVSGALRSGIGTTGLMVDHYGRVIAADTDGGQLVVFSTDPLLNRQMAPVGASPFGLADDIGRNLVWVTLTGTNEVAGFDLSSGAPVEKFRLPTIADPRTVVVDEQTGDLYIGSSTVDAVQRISAGSVN